MRSLFSTQYAAASTLRLLCATNHLPDQQIPMPTPAPPESLWLKEVLKKQQKVTQGFNYSLESQVSIYQNTGIISFRFSKHWSHKLQFLETLESKASVSRNTGTTSSSFSKHWNHKL